MRDTPIEQKLRHNYLVNLADGGFFGFAIGASSFSAILPLFVARFTDSAVLIGLITAIHNVGWQLPQLFLARWIATLTRFKPWVLKLTIHERVPFLGLALIAGLIFTQKPVLSLILTFVMLAWQGLGSGFAANVWQNMIGKIIPGSIRATFFGLQSSASNLGGSIGAVISGILLDRLPSPLDFVLCFLITVGLMGISWFFLALTREEVTPPPTAEDVPQPTAELSRHILRSDASFKWFLVARNLFQFGTMAFSFYIIYAVLKLGMSEVEAGLMAAALNITLVIANPVLGWLADHWNIQAVMTLGAVASLLSALVAFLAPSLGWFYLVIVLQGFANVTFWTIGIAFTLQFGTDRQRPVYIGLANTLIAPSTILAPLVGGWLADAINYQATFLVSAGLSGLTALIFLLFVKNPPVRKAEAG
ncbi:MAG TPA: MFS transporter [Anaerolineaceae bacterium]|nr:MFS transporter [Anaerolineaceae bacterium]